MQETANQYYNNDNLAAKAGIDLDLNDKNSFNFSGSYGKQGYDQGTRANYNNSYGTRDVKIYNTSANTLDVTGNVVELNLDYQHKYTDNQTVSVTNHYFSWDGRDENTLTEMATDENFNEQGLHSKLNYAKGNFNYQYRLNVDYKHPIRKSSLEAGLQFRHEDRDDDLNFRNFDIADNAWIPNSQFTYKLDYLNDIYSAYASFSGTRWGIGYMLGARTEYFRRSIGFSNDSSEYRFNKFMMYPTVHLSKDINGKHQFQLSYSRRINWPQPWLLNKTPGYLDPYNIFQGSPTLEPEYADAFEFNYRYFYKITTLSVQTYFRNTSNSFNTLRELQANGIMIHQLINANSQQSCGVEGGLDLSLYKWWQLSTGANIYHYIISALVNNANSRRNANSWDARLINNFSLKWGSKLQVVACYRGAGIDAQGNASGFYLVNVSANQPLLKGRASIGFTAENLLNSIKFDYTVKSEQYNNDYLIHSEGPVLMLTATYSFNNFQTKQRGRTDDANFKGGGLF